MQRTIQQHFCFDVRKCGDRDLPPPSFGQERKVQTANSNKTYRRPRRQFPTFVVLRTVGGRLAVVLRGGISLGGVEGVVRVRLEAGLGGVGADLKGQPTVSSRNATKKQTHNKNKTKQNNGLIHKTPFRVPRTRTTNNEL